MNKKIDINDKEIYLYIDDYLNNIGWNNISKDMLTIKERIKNMYFNEIKHNVKLINKNIKIKNIFNSNLLSTLNIKTRVEHLNEVLKLKEKKDIFNYSINSVNKIINKYIN